MKTSCNVQGRVVGRVPIVNMTSLKTPSLFFLPFMFERAQNKMEVCSILSPVDLFSSLGQRKVLDGI